MDLTTLKEYPHKIIKIDVNNKNNIADSMSKTALFKVTLTKEDNEIILFSYDKELNQSIGRTKSGNDYFLTILNITGITTIYAHFLMADLYNGTELSENDGNLVEYDLTKLQNFQSDTYYVSNDAHPQISSKLTDSINTVTQEKNPNYKQYNIDTDINQRPIKDRFPISSRYSADKNKELIAPNVNDQAPGTKFTRTNNNTTSKWEAHIPRKDIGDIIPKDTGKEQHPINVFLNYEYLPTTTKYHQHFYGFEALQETEDRDINVFEGDNLETVNGAFFDNDEKYTYRLINWGDKTDHSHAIYVNRNAPTIMPTEIAEPNVISQSCDWIRNNCEDFYIYTPLNDNEDRGLYYTVTLKKDTLYILKYYIFIPSSVKVDSDCYIEVQSINENTGEIIDTWSIDSVFKKQDEFLTDQWVYHEVPFKTTVHNHHIYIKGHKEIDKDIYFANIQIQENAQYSPTIKYTNHGIFVVENDQAADKPNTDYERTEYPPMQYKNPKIATITEPNTPYNDIYINFDEDFSIDYNEKTKVLSYYPNKGYIISYSQEGNDDIEDDIQEPWGLYINNNHNIINDNDNDVEFSYDVLVLELDENKDLLLRYNAQQVFTYGTNNSFKLKVESEHNNRINNGFIECAITENQNEDDDIKRNTIKYIGKKYVGDDGTIEYTRLDFSKLNKNKKYYLRIDYTHPCFNNKTIVYKKVRFVNENAEMTIKTIKNNDISNGDIITIESIEEFPLQIIADIHQKYFTNIKFNKGYCELSINDEVKQTSYVNADGIAEFYLNKITDNLTTSQVIKIEYYNKYNTVEEYGYFTLELASNFQGKDAVPIRLNILSNDEIEQIQDNIDIDKNDCLLIDIDTNDNRYINYSIRLYKLNGDNKEYITFSNNKTYVNITSTNSASNVIGDYIEDKDSFISHTVQYTAVTDALIQDIDNNGDVIYSNNQKYRKYEKYITVTWKEA